MFQIDSYIIYKVTNVLDGKVYIGATSSTLKKRRTWHYSNAKKRRDDEYLSNTKFFQALRQYPKDIFTWEAIDSAPNKHEAILLEADYIRKFNAIINGYNEKPSDLVPWNTGRKLDEKYCSLVRGTKNGMFGKTHSKDVREKLSQRMKQCQTGAKNHMAKKVYCVELDKSWDTVKACAEELGIHKDSIAHCCTGKNKTAGGYHFKYIEGSSQREHGYNCGKNNAKARRVYCIELNKFWNTLKECADQIGCTPQAISKVCGGARSTVKGLHFIYA